VFTLSASVWSLTSASFSESDDELDSLLDSSDSWPSSMSSKAGCSCMVWHANECEQSIFY
jgi:hypothetical protein